MKRAIFSSDKRINFIRIIVSLVIVLMVSKLAMVQLVQSKDLKKGALDQITKAVKIDSKRGIIYDKNGKKLAVNTSAYTPWVIKKDVRDMRFFCDEISTILDMDSEVLYERLSSNQYNEKLTQWISKEQADKITELKAKDKSNDFMGITVEESDRRYYPLENQASYILGFTDLDGKGVEGIESYYDTSLTGEPGRWIKTTDGFMRKLPFGEDKKFEPKNGAHAVLNIDEVIQNYCYIAAEKALEQHSAKSVSVIAMDPRDGAIRALVVKEDYNPNKPREARNEEEREAWKDLEGEELLKEWYEVWRNKTISESYEPGSTIKVITMAAALEENITNPEKRYLCNGIFTEIPKVRLKCYRWENPHGNITLREGLEESCNLVFIRVAREMGKNKFYNYLKAFGYGEVSGIDLYGEQEGVLPRYDDIKDVNVATMSYGHGVSLTPIQLINSICAVVNGGKLMKPRIVDKFIDDDNKIINRNEPVVIREVISKKTSDEMLKQLEGVVKAGGGKRARVPGYRIGGKTGTADKLINGEYPKGKLIVSFVAVAPIDDPQLALLVIVDEPKTERSTGGGVAAPIAREILERTLPYMGISKTEDIDTTKMSNNTVEMPSLIGLEAKEAGKILNEIGIRFTTEYKGSSVDAIIIGQEPKDGSIFDKNNIAKLILDDNIKENTVPDFKGISRNEAKNILEELGVEYELQGKGTAVNQIPIFGEKISDDTKIIIEFKEE